MRILVTGGTGFLGRALLPLLAAEHEVVAVARRSPTPALAPHAEWIELDLAAPLDPARLPGTADAVVHLAQSARYREFPAGAADVYAVNTHSTFELLEWARGAGVSRFVHASTGGVYRPGPEPLSEDAPIAPPGLYPASKYAAELLVRSYGSLLTPVVLRFFFLYGPGQEAMMMPTLAGRVLRDEPVQVRGNPGIRMNPIYVEDAARAVLGALALEQGATVNVAGDETVTLTELVQRLGAAAGRAPRIEHAEADAAGDLLADTARMADLLGVRPATGLDDGLARLVTGLRADAG